MEEVEATILEALRAKVGGQARLADELTSLSIDSPAMAELALEIEQRLKVRLDEGVLEQRTVQDIVTYVKTLIEKQQTAKPPPKPASTPR